jgi:Cu-processing system permease protein
MLLQLDISALMGYTGAFYKNFFGSSFGIIFSSVVLLIWIIVPVGLALRIFNRKDL